MLQLARHEDPIVAGRDGERARRGRHRPRLRRVASAPHRRDLRPSARAAPGDLHAFPRCRRARRSTRAWRSSSPRRIRTPAKTCSSCRATAARSCCSCCSRAAWKQAAERDEANGRERLPHLRIANPGEFTERAFLNDKLDLAQAEAVADLIDASTEAAARSAARSLDGAFSSEIDALAAALVELRLLVEATLDFPEEEIDFLVSADALGPAAARDGRRRRGAAARAPGRLAARRHPRRPRRPAQRRQELAAERARRRRAGDRHGDAGTTRDKVAQTIQIEGVPVHVVDTAGLRDAVDEVERIGVARTWAEIEGADAIVFLHDLTRLGDAGYEAGDAAIAARLPARLADAGRLLHLFNKLDLQRSASVDEGRGRLGAHRRRASTPCARGCSSSPAGRRRPRVLFIARARHVHALQRARQHLELAAAHAERGNAALELFAEELRLAHDALGEITGAFTSEDLLGAIFGRFCIGK
jgi:tRNA modification GTPase